MIFLVGRKGEFFGRTGMTNSSRFGRFGQHTAGRSDHRPNAPNSSSSLMCLSLSTIMQGPRTPRSNPIAHSSPSCKRSIGKHFKIWFSRKKHFAIGLLYNTLMFPTHQLRSRRALGDRRALLSRLKPTRCALEI